MHRPRWSLVLATTCGITSLVLVGVSITITLVAHACPTDFPTPVLATLHVAQVRTQLLAAAACLWFAAMLVIRLLGGAAAPPSRTDQSALSEQARRGRRLLATVWFVGMLAMVGLSLASASESIRHSLLAGADRITDAPAFLGLGLTACLTAAAFAGYGHVLLRNCSAAPQPAREPALEPIA